MKQRSPGQTAISISIPEKLLAEIDRRAESLDLNRSQYLSMLAKQDLRTLGPLILQSNEPVATKVQLGGEAS